MKVVVGYDGSPHAKRALERAARFSVGDPVIVVSVVPMSGPAGRGPAEIEPERLDVHYEQLAEAERILKSQNVQAELIETLGNAIGDTADALMHVAREHDAELIVVGARGLGGLKRLVVGSVSGKLVREAPCDVMVVR